MMLSKENRAKMEERNKAWVKLFLSGKNCAQIAKLSGVTASIVSRIVRASGARAKYTKKHFTVACIHCKKVYSRHDMPRISGGKKVWRNTRKTCSKKCWTAYQSTHTKISAKARANHTPESFIKAAITIRAKKLQAIERFEKVQGIVL